MKGNCCLLLPYPKVEGGDISEQELLDLYEVYGGRRSELCAVLTYQYQVAVCKEKFAELSEVLQGISVCEMNHLRLLADALTAFSAPPLYRGKHNYFSASAVNYDGDVKQFLMENIEEESFSEQRYRLLAAGTDHPSLSALYTRISMDESLHQKLLGEQIEKLFD